MKKQNGSATIEIIPAASFIALFILVCAQFSALFTQAVHDVAYAESEASEIVSDWDASHGGDGLERPCLEDMPAKSATSGGRLVTVGAGIWKREIGVPQEVKIVRRPVCISW